MRKDKVEIVLDNGIRCIITEKSDKKNIGMFEEASRLTKKKEQRAWAKNTSAKKKQ